MKKNHAFRAATVLILLLVAGIAIVCINKFQYSVEYSKNVRLEIGIEKNFEIEDVQEIASKVYPEQEIIVQKLGDFQDNIAITVSNTTEEQNEQLINKVNEKYNTTLKTEDISIYYNSNIRGRDLIIPYIGVSIIAGILILVFFGIRYHGIGVFTVISRVLMITAGTVLLYLLLSSIFNMPINSITIASAIAVVSFCLMYLSANFEKAIEKE